MRIVTLKDLKPTKGIGYTAEHLRRLEAAGKFPRRIKIGENRVAWLESEIDAWIAQKAEERSQ
ncbi:MAG: AlpA family phage regulatory protein [Rhodomicrobium sp.]